MRIAIVGAGVSGLICAWLLARRHEITLFEHESRLGGHSNTILIEHEGRKIPVDSGFIVYNERNYPNFSTILDRLEVETTPTEMTFGLRDDRTGLEYGGASLGALFAQRRNLLSPRFHSMIRDILRFYRESVATLEAEPAERTLGEYLDAHRYRQAFREQFLYAMAGAIWSTPTGEMERFPLHFLVRFFHNHGMLDLKDRPQWRTVVGGSRRYVEKLEAALGDRVRAGTPVRGVRRDDAGAWIESKAGPPERFDEVVLACHSDQALALLEDATEGEREILGALPYRANETVLHWDRTLLPKRERAWSAWNYRVLQRETDQTIVTYNLTILQHLGTQEPICVSLNQTGDIDPSKVFARFRFDHPVYTLEGLRAQERYHEIGGVNRTHFAGAYWFNGFHEDGVRSALRVAQHFGEAL